MEKQNVLRGTVVDFTRPDSTFLIHRIFEKQLKTNSDIVDRVALKYGSKTVSYRQLNDNANRIARYIRINLLNNQRGENGNASDQPKIIAICLPPSDELIVIILAILKLGIAYLPLDVSYPRPRVAHILKDSSPLAVVANEANVANVRNAWSGLVISAESLSLRGKAKEAKSDDLQDDEMIDCNPSLFGVLYTSGSTGVPKGVAISYKSLFNRLNWQWMMFPYSKDEICCFKSAIVFVDSVAEIFGPLLSGKQLVVVSKDELQDTEKFLSILEQNSIERLVTVPSLLRTMFLFIRLHPEQIRLPALRLIISSGETLSVELVQEYFELFPTGKKLANFYGSTEVMADVTFAVFDSIDDAKNQIIDGMIPLGIPVSNTDVYLLDQERSIVSSEHVGEIFISGLNVGSYLHSNTADDRFIDNKFSSKVGHQTLYRTGDFGQIINNVLYYKGRADAQIKIRGQRADLSEIERALLAISHVSTGIVLCYHPGQHDQNIFAFFKPKDDGISEAKVTEILRNNLTSYMVPNVIKVDKFPLLTNGKIDRQELLRRLESRITSTQHPVLELTGIEEHLAHSATALVDAINNVVGVSLQKPLSLDSSFFEIGGNSLNVVMVISYLKDKGYSISIADFIRSETLMDIIKRMQFTGVNATMQKDLTVCEKYHSVPITTIPKHVVVAMTAKSFVNKGDLEKYTKANTEEFTEFIENFWDAMINSGVSLGILNTSNELVAVTLNTDLRNEPTFTLSSRMKIVLEFLEQVEGPAHYQLLQTRDKIMHGILMATAAHLTPAENIEVIQFMEEEILRMAKEHKFDTVLTTNTSPLTQEVCEKLLNYEIFSSVQINQYRDHNGWAPFASAKDTERVLVAFKYIE